MKKNSKVKDCLSFLVCANVAVTVMFGLCCAVLAQNVRDVDSIETFKDIYCTPTAAYMHGIVSLMGILGTLVFRKFDQGK